MTNWRALCEELVLGWDVDGCDWKPQHQARWNAAIERARALLAQPEPEVVGPSVEELDDLFNEIDQSGEPLSWRAYARAVLSRWGRPAPAPAGEVAELARLLRLDAELERGDGMPQAAARFDRAAELLEQLNTAQTPQPVPDCERNWDSILSPSGGYEMAEDAALSDGAQLVNGEWWAPVFGCDSLESTLKRIRERLERQAVLLTAEAERAEQQP